MIFAPIDIVRTACDKQVDGMMPTMTWKKLAQNDSAVSGSSLQSTPKKEILMVFWQPFLQQACIILKLLEEDNKSWQP